MRGNGLERSRKIGFVIDERWREMEFEVEWEEVVEGTLNRTRLGPEL